MSTETAKTTVVLCSSCEGPLFTLNWLMQDAKSGPSGLYRTCAGCGKTDAIIEGYQSVGYNANNGTS